jgi:predicted small secreted protein
MKRSILAVIIIGLLTFTLIACNSGDGKGDSTEKGGNAVTVESILELFDSDVYHAQKYDSKMISQIKENIAKQGITLSGEIKAIVHVTNQNDTSRETNIWAYIYEFSNEADATAFYENRNEYVKVALEDGLCVRKGLIVVFGSAEEISLIK